MTMIRLFRFEHNCGDSYVEGAGHGTMSGTCYNEQAAPKFGGRGDAPQRISNHQICGVSMDQFSIWWRVSNENWRGSGSQNHLIDEIIDEIEEYHFIHGQSNEWNLIEYVIELRHAREDNDQYIFEPKNAEERIVHKDPTGFLAELKAFADQKVTTSTSVASRVWTLIAA